MKSVRHTLLASTACVGLAFAGAVGVGAVLAPAAQAQSYTTGAANGQITDESGQPIAGATITMVNTARGTTRSVSSGADGGFFVGRLPVGEYSITIRRDGYQPITNGMVQVNVGGTTQYGFQMTRGSSSADVITVTGTAVQANTFQVAETGITIDVDEVFGQIPVGRSLTALTLLAPGTVEADSAFGGASISGSSAGENAFYINGMNISDFRNFTGASTVPFEFYRQVEVKTGGYQAEFGRATGGVTNAVTRSGSNEFHWGFNAYYSPDELRSDSPDTVYAANRFDQSTSTDFNVWASGPVIPDRLFAYALYAPRFRENINISEGGTQTIDRSDDPFWGVKLDANLFDGHTLEFTAFSDSRTTQRQSNQVTVTDEDYTFSSDSGQTDFAAGGDIYIGNYTGALTDWLTLSLTYGTQTFDQSTTPTTANVSAIRDLRNGTYLTNYSSLSVVTGQDRRELFRADVDVFANFFGEHNIRFGMDREELRADESNVYTGDGNYYLYYRAAVCESLGGAAGEDCVRLINYNNVGGFETIQTAFYIQDSWQVTDQFTLNLGVRNETFDNRNLDGDTFVELSNQIAPRIGASYDVFGDGRLEAYAFWGRYFLPIATNTNIRMAGRESYTSDFYSFTGMGADFRPTGLGATPFYNSVYADGQLNDPREVTDANLDPMYKDEFILGARWMMNDLWDFGLSYTHRDLKTTIEDGAIDAAVLDYCNDNGIAGCDAIWDGFHQYVLTNPGETMRVYLADLPGGGQWADLSPEDLGYPTPTNTYEALELTFSRAFADGWALSGSWTISNSEGNYEGPVKSDNGQDDAGITIDYDTPGLTDGTDGQLPNHRAHKFKLWGHYEVNDVFTVGASFQATSPRSFGCIGYHPTDNFAQQYGAASWYCNSTLTPRGSQLESEWTYNLDMNFVYRPDHLPFGGEPTFRVDIFNVFNASSVTDVDEYGEDGLNVPAQYVNSRGTTTNTYGQPIGYQAPRSVRLGLSWDF